MSVMSLTLGGRRVDVPIENVVIAGWAGRDREAVEAHIAELEEVGVPRPSSVPVFYRVSASRLTTSTAIESTAASSGEVEAVLLRHDGQLWVGVGSDHTDRDVETYSVAVSKQLCDKPIAGEFWSYDDIIARWDQLILRSWIDGGVSYQQGSLSGLLRPEELISAAPLIDRDGTVMYCGTLAAQGGIRPSHDFRYALEDPVTTSRIESRYSMRDVPMVA